ncbi:hypothetical protein N7478_013010 [Penicillium angulare]|uniref:uncharacterized protein n=1 Tax=Penicillium angulare TaxID=116970 RepID=UPI00253FB545|nr:uncharacterized protein N7478_013010 [Penicillium angulare]KAJ5256906.1 hypothetical protein N7478_013010 [Penicillium angulare]
MPHQPRPVSPVAFESCIIPATNSDSDPYELLGSDDEFDDKARAKKRQRIERLAESYLRGGSLFISTAKLRGPFDDGWKNPWRKERKTVDKSDPQSSMKLSEMMDQKGSACMQETNPADRMNKLHSTVVTRPASASVRETASPQPQFQPQPPHSVQSRQSALGRSPSGARDVPELPRGLREVSSPGHQHTILETGSIDWLRKDKKRMNFTSFDPPTSPTPTSGHRRIGEHQSRGSRPRSVAPVSSRGSPAKSMSHDSVTGRKQSTDSNSTAASPLQAIGSPAGVPMRSPAPTTTRHSTVAPVNSPDRNEQVASFRVVSSTSQLSRFEYKRLRIPGSSPQLKLQSPVEKTTTANHYPSAYPESRMDIPTPIHKVDNTSLVEEVNKIEVDVITENDAMDLEEGHRNQSPPANLSKSLRFTDYTQGATSRGENLSPPTDHDTYEELPSAQEMPAPSGVSSRLPSLHSTAVPKENSNLSTDTTPNTQLSTQAALLHAQRSFQDDLDSPVREYGTTPAQLRGIDAGEESLLAHETPLFRPDTSEKALRRSLGDSEARKIQATSTQCMLDAATPYTFSTGKKPRAFRSVSPQKPGSIRPRAIHTAQCPESSSPLPDNDHALEARYESPSPDRTLADQPPDHHMITHRHTTQAPPLPFALSGSTPMTTQDGQGGLQTGDSFNLSQAIADAGSWLQQSFDFMKSTRRPSLNEQVPSDAAPPSTLNFDTPN